MKDKMLEKIKNINNRVIIFLFVFILFSILVIIANSVLLNGTNMMKNDIMDAHYPISTYIGDCLKQGQIPLWNPMIKYGTPHYAIAGMPVWYPTTMILSLFRFYCYKSCF